MHLRSFGSKDVMFFPFSSPHALIIKASSAACLGLDTQSCQRRTWLITITVILSEISCHYSHCCYPPHPLSFTMWKSPMLFFFDLPSSTIFCTTCSCSRVWVVVGFCSITLTSVFCNTEWFQSFAKMNSGTLCVRLRYKVYPFLPKDRRKGQSSHQLPFPCWGVACPLHVSQRGWCVQGVT